MALTAAEIKSLLNLAPLPGEGGYFLRTFESAERVNAQAGPRFAGTAIYYFLEPGTFSEMHRLTADEVFHFYAGDPVEQLHLHPGGTASRIVIGTNLPAGERPQVVVPRGTWQGARLVEGGAWALLGCTVSPGYEPEDYEDSTGDALSAQWPQWETMIRALTRR